MNANTASDRLPGSEKVSSSGLLRNEKIAAPHIDRLACVYIRQSSPQQVVRNQESTQVQYSLRRRAIDLGWPEDRVVVIDEDLGKSGASSEGRTGFQRLVADVSLNHVGIIFGVEMSRLARSCKDWYQLLEVCALFSTLIADMDGVYDPSQYNDRLLLGLKGTMSEAELHIIKQRMYQGSLNKARRGDLVARVPMGYVLRPKGEVILDPDEEVQETVRTLFRTFEEKGSVHATLRFLVEQGIKFPIRATSGPTQGEIEWRRPCRVTLQYVLKNPMYAGAYVFGRRPIDPRRKIPGRPRTGQRTVPPEEWKVFLKDRYPAYITWDRHEAILERIQANRNLPKEVGSPRRGDALLGGLVACPRCNRRLMVHYRRGKEGGHDYVCDRLVSELAEPRCQMIAGRVLDDFVVEQVLKALEPASLDLSLRAAENIERRRGEEDLLWQKRLERVRFEAERAGRHYRQVEPEQRLVARELGREWEQKLAAQRSAEEEYERFQRTQPRLLTAEERETVRRLAADIPALWASPSTTNADRKEILRQVLDRVVVQVVGRTEQVHLRIEWAGGMHSSHEIRRPVARAEHLSYWPQLAARLRELVAAGSTVEEIINTLAAEGWRTSYGEARFHAGQLWYIFKRLGLRLRHRRDLDASAIEKDEWWMTTLARELGVCRVTIFHWIHDGWVRARRLPDGRWAVHADAETLARLRTYTTAPRSPRPRRRYFQERSLPNPADVPVAPNGNGIVMPRERSAVTERPRNTMGIEAESGPTPDPEG